MTIEVVLEGNKGKYVADCGNCEAVFTYELDDLKKNTFSNEINCPECGSKIMFQEPVKYTWKKKKVYDEIKNKKISDIGENKWNVVTVQKGNVSYIRNISLSEAEKIKKLLSTDDMKIEILGPEGWDGCFKSMKHEYDRISNIPSMLEEILLNRQNNSNYKEYRKR